MTVTVVQAWTQSTQISVEDTETLVPEADGEYEAVVGGHDEAHVRHAQPLVEVVAETATDEACTKHCTHIAAGVAHRSAGLVQQACNSLCVRDTLVDLGFFRAG